MWHLFCFCTFFAYIVRILTRSSVWTCCQDRDNTLALLIPIPMSHVACFLHTYTPVKQKEIPSQKKPAAKTVQKPVPAAETKQSGKLGMGLKRKSDESAGALQPKKRGGLALLKE